ncbi:hypothetical protein ACJ6WF_05535 [Streptomyces sp. MMS24-I2-30]|uniref:hypothetical protein n=1 Tax=Streptomyces sp. MMS24-I2-30 TaxID=3351564 RepID=UPI0038969B9B
MAAEDAYARLGETLERLAHAAGRPERLTDALDVADLSLHAGVPEAVVRSLLDGGFFAQPPGFLTADEPEALNEALQPVLRGLEARSDPLAALRTPEFRRLAVRAPHILPDALSSLSRWADMITCPDADGPGTGTEGSGPTGGDCR